MLSLQAFLGHELRIFWYGSAKSSPLIPSLMTSDIKIILFYVFFFVDYARVLEPRPLKEANVRIFNSHV